MDTWTGRTSSLDGAAKRIHSPGEYKLASSRAPACCGPHLAAPRPGPCGSGFCVSAPQPFSLTILAISPPWAQPLQSLYSQPGTNGNINFSAHRQRSVFDQSSENRWAQQPISFRGDVPQKADWPIGIARGKTAFPDPTRPLWSSRCSLSLYCWMYSRWSPLTLNEKKQWGS